MAGREGSKMENLKSGSNLSEPAKIVNECCRELITPKNLQTGLTAMSNEIAGNFLSPDHPKVIDACLLCTKLESEALTQTENPDWRKIITNYYAKLQTSLRSAGGKEFIEQNSQESAS